MKYQNIKEEEIKNKVAQDYFWKYDCTRIIGNVDFCVSMHQSKKDISEQESLLWAEAKKGSSNIYNSLVQLILTIGKARTFDKYLPPAMLGAFDGEKIAFIPYNDIQEIFYTNDFNWNVTPSNHDTKEFKLIHEKVKSIIESKALLFNFLKDDKDLNQFIKTNFIVGKFGLNKSQIDKNNFISVFNRWVVEVKPTIAVNWDIAKKSNLIDGDFYLADLLSEENFTLKEKLFVLLKNDHYEFDRKLSDSGFFTQSTTSFKDNQVAHTQFWNRYERPPKEEYWDYIVERRDLLVPQDVRERKGSFFTPQIWVELSQKYLTDVLGVDWQDEYYVWDCAAGTGNLLTGLTNKYNIFASTLDKQDVEVMKDRIKNGANLLEDHVFQFDFLNDDFSKLPKPLHDIINDPEKRKKLVVYINPPYAEAASSKTVSGTGENKTSASNTTNTHILLQNLGLGNSNRELFVQFLLRIYFEIPGAVIANFSKTKIIQSSNFKNFRKHFKAKLVKLFLSPATTFDNVVGQFPIGFFIWNTLESAVFDSILADVYDSKSNKIKDKLLANYDLLPNGLINDWLKKFTNNSKNEIASMCCKGNDVQNNNLININLSHVLKGVGNAKGVTKFKINLTNIIQVSVYFAVRHSIEFSWVNDRDQFMHPNSGWELDKEFQNNCLTFTLFYGQNRISATNGTNHWIPFTEQEVNSRAKFESNFMTQFINGKLKKEQTNLFDSPPRDGNLGKLKLSIEKTTSLANASTPPLDGNFSGTSPLEFSIEAKAVFDAGRELWKYYHKQPNINVNASLYDIREYFQGRNEKGKMNNKSKDEVYNKLIGDLRDRLKDLAKKIEPKVYEYGFLKK